MVFMISGYGDMIFLRLFTTPLYFILGPGIYFYVIKYNNSEARFTIKDLAHLIPSGIAIAYYHPKFFSSGWASFIDYNAITDFFWDLFLVHLIVYIYFTVLSVRKIIKASEKNPFSFGPVNSWFVFLYRFFTLLFLIMTVVTIDFRILTNTGFGIGLSDNVIAVFGVFFICGISFKGLMHPAVFFGKPEIFSFRKNAAIMSPERVKFIMNRLNSLFEKEKPHLDPHLTLPDLSEITGFSRTDLSNAINSDRNQNFYDYINSYRVETVKELLSANKEMNMIEVAQSSGFKSKSTFNDAFKRSTGFTPTEYKNFVTTEKTLI